MVAKSLFVCLLLGLLLLYPASASTLLSSSSESSSVETSPSPQPLSRVHSHIDHTSDMALHLLDSLDGKHARGWTLADLWSPMADDAKAHHDVKRGDLLSKERLADFAAGGVLGVVFVLVAMGVGVTCRLFVCRRRRTECHIINSSLVDPAEAEAEALLPEFSYTDLEQERLKRLKESGQQQQPKRKWWQNGRGRVEAAQLANEPQEVEQMAPAAAKVHQCDVEEGLKEQVEGGEPKSHQEAQSQSLLLFGRWRWTQAPPRGSAAAAASATRDTSSRPLAVTQLDPSPSPPWKRRASEGARVV